MTVLWRLSRYSRTFWLVSAIAIAASDSGGLSHRYEGSPGQIKDVVVCMSECSPILNLQSRPHTLHRNSLVVVIAYPFQTFAACASPVAWELLWLRSLERLSCIMLATKFALLPTTRILLVQCCRRWVWSWGRPYSACVVPHVTDHLVQVWTAVH